MSSPELPWRKLVESIKRGNCILLLGPQVSFDPEDSDHLPLTTLLARRLASHEVLAETKDLVNRDDLAHVAQLFKQRSDRYGLEIEVKDFYDAYQNLVTDFHRDLAALPFTLCINTTPDHLFSNALVEAGKKPVRDYYNYQLTTSVLVRRMSSNLLPKSLIFIACMVTMMMLIQNPWNLWFWQKMIF